MTKKIEKKPVFDVLFEKEICFAVCIAVNKFINRQITNSSKDYFVIINKCHALCINELTFYPSYGYNHICERSLTPEEIEIFKKDISKFERVLSNENGKIYELKDQPFKKGYDEIRKKIKG
jgi:hypothetical protein